jgi:hypothetical protein
MTALAAETRTACGMVSENGDTLGDRRYRRERQHRQRSGSDGPGVTPRDTEGSFPMHSPIVFAGIGVLSAIALAGCGSTSNDSTSPTATAGKSGAQVEVGNTINYGSFGTTTEIDCADGKSLNVGGSNNTLTVKGSCASVNIGGADNKITFDKIDSELSVVGLNNTVTYKGDPKVNNLGSGNTINKS